MAGEVEKIVSFTRYSLCGLALSCLVDFESTCCQQLKAEVRRKYFSSLKFLICDKRRKLRTQNIKMELSRRAFFQLLLKRNSYSSTISLLPELSDIGCVHAKQKKIR